MFDKLEIFRMAQGLAVHSAARQAAIAENIANADTPGYRARDLAPFEQSYQAGTGGTMRATRPGHFGDAGVADPVDLTRLTTTRSGATSPNGNTVSLEQEMMEAAGVKGKHDRALAIYKSALNIMRTSVNGGR
ncbi:FlgB family protein [Maritimibacter sp. UBA3975]|uniref:FlgB family protein n=1 Tax=Maritimibacter sp. UBA3975 TaxID=1946833 RepID=UPI000C0B591C|nr:FlgB family protein [Maritimibacter sp. UBA3975]MAM61844.1 hypothetical protein [Maritimibacter sp.]